MTSKTVLITGAAQRIGAVIARDLHQHGWDIAIHYKQSSAEADVLATELNAIRNNSATLIQGDLLDPASYATVIEQACNWKERLDALVNNASAFYPSEINKATLEQWEELVGTNMKAPFFLAQHASDYLRKSQGAIINITDIHADKPLKNHSIYCAAKAGLVMLTKALAKDLGPDICVNAISPGAILWPTEMDKTTQDDILSRIPLQRAGNPGDISSAVRYLLEDASYVTGQILAIDGGRTLNS